MFISRRCGWLDLRAAKKRVQ